MEPDFTVNKNVPLSEVTTFHLGGQCKGLIYCRTPQELKKIASHFLRQGEKYLVIGWGSNVLVSDHGLDIYVIRYVTDQPDIRRMGNDLVVSASTKLDDLVQYTVHAGLKGLVFASGIPGTLGGAVVGNVGAFGWQMSDVIRSVNVLDEQGQEKNIPIQDIDFSYRESMFKHSEDIILSVVFSLQVSDEKYLTARRAEILKDRQGKHPDPSKVPCAGSFFKNIKLPSQLERTSAGWFIDQACGKEMTVGGAGIYERHANILVKKSENCTAQDVYALSLKIAQCVKKRFEIDLVPEVRIIGHFEPNSSPRGLASG